MKRRKQEQGVHQGEKKRWRKGRMRRDGEDRASVEEVDEIDTV